MPDWGAVVRSARTRRGLSQRALARAAGVPPSTVNRIELGHMSPTVETLDRLLAATGCEAQVLLVPSVDDALTTKGLNESERRSLVLGILTARHLLLDPTRAVAIAHRNLDRMAGASRSASQPYLDAWRALLDGPLDDVLAALTGLDERARALRQATPFAGLVPDSARQAALKRLRAA